MSFRWRADDDPTLNAGSIASKIVRESGPELLRNPIFFVIFQGGGGGCLDPAPPSGSTHVSPKACGVSHCQTVKSNLKLAFIQLLCYIICALLIVKKRMNKICLTCV